MPKHVKSTQQRQPEGKITSKRRPRKRQQSLIEKPAAVFPPAFARPEKLPLGDSNISWDQFETFSRDFVGKLDGVVDSKHYGTRGSKQKGIDFYSYGTVRMADDFTKAGSLNSHFPELFNNTTTSERKTA